MTIPSITKSPNRYYLLANLILIILIANPFESFSQGTTPDSLRAGALRVFIDCHRCDMDYIREEIPYVNYVRDVKEAQVYLLVNTQDAGSGGSQYMIRYQGSGEFKGMNDTLKYSTSPDDTGTEIRERLTETMKMGLMRYVARTPLAREIKIEHLGNTVDEEVVDKWNNWVFELEMSPQIQSEESYKQLEFENAVSVSRVTPKMKFLLEFDQDITRERFIDKEENEDTTIMRTRESINSIMVFSLDDHWSIGALINMGRSSRQNFDFDGSFLPSIEYNLFPYSEASHRQMRFLYSIGYRYSNYTDTTIYNLTSEGRLMHELNIAYAIQQKWGSINVSLGATNYFFDLTKTRVELDGFMRFRIVKGLSVFINTEVAYINDQLGLKKNAITEAERLLKLRELQTSYNLEFGVGLSYTFGSIYNNIVNPRFGN